MSGTLSRKPYWVLKMELEEEYGLSGNVAEKLADRFWPLCDELFRERCQKTAKSITVLTQPCLRADCVQNRRRVESLGDRLDERLATLREENKALRDQLRTASKCFEELEALLEFYRIMANDSRKAMLEGHFKNGDLSRRVQQCDMLCQEFTECRRFLLNSHEGEIKFPIIEPSAEKAKQDEHVHQDVTQPILEELDTVWSVNLWLASETYLLAGIARKLLKTIALPDIWSLDESEITFLEDVFERLNMIYDPFTASKVSQRMGRPQSAAGSKTHQAEFKSVPSWIPERSPWSCVFYSCCLP